MKKGIDKYLKSLDNLIDKVKVEQEKVNRSFELNDYFGLTNSSFELQVATEKLVNASRGLPTILGNHNNMTKVEDIIIKENKTKVEITEEGWFKLTVPSMLQKKEKGDASYIRATTQVALKEYFMKNKQVRFNEPSVIIFIHNYDKSIPEKEYRDHDNIELNVIVDSIALHVLKDDHPLMLQHHYCSKPSDTTKTEVLIVPIKDFGSWWEQEGLLCVSGGDRDDV